MTEKRTEVCQKQCFHPEMVAAVRESMMKKEVLQELADLFKALGDHTRVKILNALYHAELCVCDLTAILDMNQSAVSHQLRVLRVGKIVKSRKDGKNVYYSLDDKHIFKLLDLGSEHVREESL
ncbi:MAG: winged helix-turn-helix transcriptional regulator [Chlorobium phaeobacteroides]|uniref:Transcriptional regulator, ArsR family n=1 Tax=Chlorobium phaeobacteroides (strain BS1) TaxID=331678 RepID=B3EMA2_CHLPB|nr:winged helix-turn-helix transcriptional regulator [Chlorobium phaeobacteroides]MBL6955791.1 winged helix-turn-helix transcriptional regulator [Chlorobium phaeobacteroides]